MCKVNADNMIRDSTNDFKPLFLFNIYGEISFFFSDCETLYLHDVIMNISNDNDDLFNIILHELSCVI